MQHLHKFTSPVNGERRTELEMDLKPELELETYLKPETWLELFRQRVSVRAGDDAGLLNGSSEIITISGHHEKSSSSPSLPFPSTILVEQKIIACFCASCIRDDALHPTGWVPSWHKCDGLARCMQRLKLCNKGARGRKQASLKCVENPIL